MIYHIVITITKGEGYETFETIKTYIYNIIGDVYSIMFQS